MARRGRLPLGAFNVGLVTAGEDHLGAMQYRIGWRRDAGVRVTTSPKPCFP